MYIFMLMACAHTHAHTYLQNLHISRYEWMDEFAKIPEKTPLLPSPRKFHRRPIALLMLNIVVPTCGFAMAAVGLLPWKNKIKPHQTTYFQPVLIGNTNTHREKEGHKYVII